MYLFYRYRLVLISGLLVFFFSGCFLPIPFLGGGDDEASTPEGDLIISEAARTTQNAVSEALEEVDMALEDGRYEAAVINYNRAIQADSTNIDIYIELASLLQQLALQKKDEGDLEGALQENLRALKVLSNLVGTRLRPAVEQGIDLSTLGGFTDSFEDSDMMFEEEDTMEDTSLEEEDTMEDTPPEEEDP
jgi:tetratricopeptide (TPR) repeat protein